jgi:CRISPR/Cas system-associated exonuclease Cas4 (RecB family)
VYASETDHAFEIDYTPALGEELLSVLDEMRYALAQGAAQRDHDQVARCQACGYQDSCDQALT